MDDFVMKKKKKSDTEEGEKDKGGESGDNDSTETVTCVHTDSRQTTIQRQRALSGLQPFLPPAYDQVTVQLT